MNLSDLLGEKLIEILGTSIGFFAIIVMLFQYITKMQSRYDIKSQSKDDLINKLIQVNADSTKEIEKLVYNTQNIIAKSEQILTIIHSLIDSERLGKKKR